MTEVWKIKRALEEEVELLRKKHRDLLTKQRAKGDSTFGLGWLAIWEGQMDSYERLLATLGQKDD